MHTGRMRVLNFGSTPVRNLLRDTAPTYSAARQGLRGADDGGAVCNCYAHALALSVYAVLVAPQHFQRIPELVKELKALSHRHGTLPYNAQIFAVISSLIALEISSSKKTTFYRHMKKALGKQPLHAAKHKKARDIVNGYYDDTDSFDALPTATFMLIFELTTTDATTFEITKKLKDRHVHEDEILIEIDDAFDVIMSMLPQVLQDEGAAPLQSPLQSQSQFQSPPSPVTQVQQPLTSHLLPAPLTTHRLQAPEPAPSTPLQQTFPEYMQGESITVEEFEEFMATIPLPCVSAQPQGPASTSFEPNTFFTR